MKRSDESGAARVRRILRELDSGGGPLPKTGSVHMDVFPAASATRGRHLCPRCDGPLAVHQPDLKHHGRLIGVCKACNWWYLMERTEDVARWLIVPLPTGDQVRAAGQADPSGCQPTTP